MGFSCFPVKELFLTEAATAATHAALPIHAVCVPTDTADEAWIELAYLLAAVDVPGACEPRAEPLLRRHVGHARLAGIEAAA